ncbi:MAG: YraN family protein [Burkholderiales bacterium]|nr:YraN family protein [Burkholderiales bacterium]
MMVNTKQKGAAGESAASFFLQKNGLRLIVSNFYSRFGEIDLIMHDGDSYIFVEVKNRKAGIGSGLESITRAKQMKLVKTAQFFMMKLGRDVNCRFDAVILDDEGNVEWLKNIIIL